MRRAYDWLAVTVSDITDEIANWQPGGLANSIAATYAHTFISADEDFNQVYLGGEMVLKGEWAGRAGLSEPPPFGESKTDIYNLRVHHPRFPRSQIAVLKGLQGAHGWVATAWTPDVERTAL
ncbi:MAG: hypothetical protein WED85_06405 [Dehalococcoidia bacterium]